MMTESNKIVFGSIYKLISDQTTDVFIGSTTQRLNKCFNNHKYNYRNYLNDNHCYVKSFDLLKYDDVRIELIFEAEFDDIKELHELEDEYIKDTDNCINEIPQKKTRHDYYELHKDKHRDKKNEKAKERYERDKEIILEKQKEYKIQNKESISQKNKEYRMKNETKLKEYSSEKITCEVCNCEYARSNRYHVKSKKHLENLAK